VIRIPLGAKATLADVLRAVRDDPRPVALGGSWARSAAIVSSTPTRIAEGTHALEEALSKVLPIAAALGARVLADCRPEPAPGLLETVAVRDGELVDAAACWRCGTQGRHGSASTTSRRRRRSC
jgi:hypothetical protein